MKTAIKLPQLHSAKMNVITKTTINTSKLFTMLNLIFSTKLLTFLFSLRFETSNGITRAETGDFEAITFDTGYSDVKGYYSYVAPDGIRYTVTYIADHNGFQPKLHKSAPNQLPSAAAAITGGIVIDGIDDDRIGSKLLLTLGGGGFG